MPMDDRYLRAIELLGTVCEAYRRASGGDMAWLVGGASVVIMTDGQFQSGDFDLVLSDDQLFKKILFQYGFYEESGPNRFHFGFQHPKHPDFGWQLVSGALFDGRTDKTRRVEIELTATSVITMPPFEDMIADRLGQYCMDGGRAHPELLAQARSIFRLARRIDPAYLRQRIAEENGDPALLDG
jgi:hypothetical protein